MKQLNIKINFDMDGTIANLYAVEDWLPKLRNYNPTPYEEAVPLLRLCTFAKILNKLQKQGCEIGIISWLSKDSNEEYDKAVTEAKIKWLEKHLPSVHWDSINIVPYGTPKENFCRDFDDILFDDELQNRASWWAKGGKAYAENNIIEILKNL